MRHLRLRSPSSLHTLPEWALCALCGAFVIALLLPPEGCKVESAEIRHAVTAEPAITVKLESLCATPTGQMRCTTTWREDVTGRHQVEVLCLPSMRFEYP